MFATWLLKVHENFEYIEGYNETLTRGKKEKQLKTFGHKREHS